MQMVIEGKWRVIDNIHIFPPSVKTREKNWSKDIIFL